jgi:hypothetical protein
MPAVTTSRRLAGLAVAAVCALLAVGCAGDEANSTAAPSTTIAATTTTPAPTTTTVPPLTDDEDTWLNGISKLREQAEKTVTDTPTNLTAAAMGKIATQMRSCTPSLARLGAPTARLQPVHTLAKQGCAQSAKGAKCLATAAGIIGHAIASAAEERRLDQSIECGLTAGSKSIELLGRADIKGLEIREAATS